MRKGFFDAKEVSAKLTIARPASRFTSCASCGLYREVKSPKMEAFGNFKKRILNIGEAPGEIEDESGKQWQGKVGRRLQRKYREFGIDLFDDCLNINSANCRPTDKKGNNRAPTTDEILSCRNKVVKVIEESKPKIIIILGGCAVESIIGIKVKKDLGGIGKWRGWKIPDQQFKAWVCPIYHPSFVERSGPEAETIWDTDLDNIFRIRNEVPDFSHYQDQVRIIDNFDVVLEKIEKSQSKTICVDFETTGLKPQAEGHQIVCASVATSPDESYAFMVNNTKGISDFIKVLFDKRIKKIAHHIKFEDTWSNVIFGTPINGWYWDTMEAAHILDNRPDITSLEFQAFVHFGDSTFKDDTTEYLEAVDKKNGNSKNRILELVSSRRGQESILIRCGMDSLYEYKLAQIQQKIIYDGIK